MIWLQSPPWGRWLIASLIALIAVWVQFRPEPVVRHPFAVTDIHPGEIVGEAEVEWRLVPSGLFSPVTLGAAIAEVSTGDPVLASDLGDPGRLVPAGWWVIEAEIARDAQRGDRALVVMLDTGEVGNAVVVSGPSDDPLGNNRGSIAVEPGFAAQAAAASAQGRLAVMIKVG